MRVLYVESCLAQVVSLPLRASVISKHQKGLLWSKYERIVC